MAMCTLMIEKARNYTRPNGCRQSWTGSLVRDRAAANPRSYSEPTIQQERIRGKENDLMKKKPPGNFDLSSELKRSSLQDLSRHSAVARPSENIIWKKVLHVLSKMLLLSIIIVPTNVFLFL